MAVSSSERERSNPGTDSLSTPDDDQILGREVVDRLVVRGPGVTELLLEGGRERRRELADLKQVPLGAGVDLGLGLALLLIVDDPRWPARLDRRRSSPTA
ncbi:hypothetical protein [Enhygromyxa salina]|uniref:hypothetical protein n=1 Tax=Enhygromyxa salina TaxID=215803 RepID=UPI002158D9F2|nr:hypothetical protein [Enhygromyxa salina]